MLVLSPETVRHLNWPQRDRTTTSCSWRSHATVRASRH